MDYSFADTGKLSKKTISVWVEHKIIKTLGSLLKLRRKNTNKTKNR